MSGLGLLVTASEQANERSASASPPPAPGSDDNSAPAAGDEPEDTVMADREGSTSPPAAAAAAAAAPDGDAAAPPAPAKVGANGDDAAGRGDLELIKSQEAAGKGLYFTRRAIDQASANGHLETVKWLTANRKDGCTTDAMDLAAQGGHLDVVRWLHEHRFEGCTTAALSKAAWHGHLDVVRWFYEHNIDGDIAMAITMASESGHGEVAEWLRSHSSSKKARVGVKDGPPAAATRLTAAAAAVPMGAATGAAAAAAAAAGVPSASHPAGAAAAAGGGAGRARNYPMGPPRQIPPGGATGAATGGVMGMFGTPFGKFSPHNGISLPAMVQSLGIDAAASATGAVGMHGPGSSEGGPAGAGGAGAGEGGAGGGAAGAHRLRSNMLQSPELTLATTGGLNNQDERQLKAVMEFRKAYSAQPLEGSNIPKEPFTLFAVWFEEARIARVSEPGAMCLSTVGPTGRPSARYVMLQGFDKRGFVWYTNFESRKAQELAHNPYGAISFWWSELQRAVRIEGVVRKVGEKDNTEYFMSRPRGSQVGAWALHQSRPVESRGALEKNVKEVQDKFSSMSEVPRPSHFGGYCLRPDRIEFWKGRQSRIHDRIAYVIVDDKWQMQRLQP